MAHLAQGSRQILAVSTHHGLVQLLILNAIRQIPIPWELFWDSTEEQIVAVVTTRAEELEAMEEDVGDDDYVDQEEPEEMEIEELGNEVGPQEQVKTVESMVDVGIDIERPTSTMAEAVPQEPASLVELAKKVDNMVATEVDPQ